MKATESGSKISRYDRQDQQDVEEDDNWEGIDDNETSRGPRQRMSSSVAAGKSILGKDKLTDSATSNGSSSDTSKLLLPKQYYYFYGSVNSGTEPTTDDNVTCANTTEEAVREGRDVDDSIKRHREKSNNSPSPSGNSFDDNNSLVGESLVPTDTELEDPKSNGMKQRHHQDQEHLFYTGTGGIVLGSSANGGGSNTIHPLLKSNTSTNNTNSNLKPTTNGFTPNNHYHQGTRKYQSQISSSISTLNSTPGIMLHDSECCEKRPYLRFVLIVVSTFVIIFGTTSVLLGPEQFHMQQQRQSKSVSSVLGTTGSRTGTITSSAGTSTSPIVVQGDSSTTISTTTKSGTTSIYNSKNNDFTVPYRHIDRDTSNDPVSNFIDLSLFHPSLLLAANKKSTAFDDHGSSSSNNASATSAPTFVFPFPTGAFWTNLVLPPTADKGLSYPVAVYPYAYKWTTNQLQLSYPALHRVENDVAIHDYFFPDLTFSTTTMKTTLAKASKTSATDSTNTPPLSATKDIEENDGIIDLRHITAFDSLSITLRYESSSSSNANMFWETYLVQGSPYATIHYTQSIPKIKALSTFSNIVCPHLVTEQQQIQNEKYIKKRRKRQQEQRQQLLSLRHKDEKNKKQRRRHLMKLSGVCTASNFTISVMSDVSNVVENHTVVSLSGIQFVLQTQEGISWIMFVSEPVTLLFDSYTKTSVQFAQPFTGILRIAIIPPSSSTSSSTSTGGTVTPDTTIEGIDSDSEEKTTVETLSSGLQRLIYHAGVYPISGAVHWSFRDESNKYDSTGGSGGTSNLPITTKIVLEALSLNEAMTDLDVTPSVIDAVNATTTKTKSSSSTTQQSAKSGRIGIVTFKYETGASAAPGPTLLTGTATKPLLMLALPHHTQSLDPNIQLNHNSFDLVYKCIKGPMRPVLGSSWSYNEPLLSFGFDGGTGSNIQQESNGNNQVFHPIVRSKIMEALHQDIKLVLPTLQEDMYGFGKQAARLAQLAYIAGVIRTSNNVSSSVQSNRDVETMKSSSPSIDAFDPPTLGQEDVEALTIQQEALSVLKDRIVSLFLDKTDDTLLYDTSMGGLITSNGLYDSHADFGNGRYNDHHFHYGYLLYACAILGKLDPTFVKEYSDHVDAIYYDVANDSNFNSKDITDNVFYPGSRHKVWYDGHSFASGMFPFGNGKSQESSSEAVNCYYGAYLWSLVRNGAADNPSSDTSARTDFARLLLASEINGAKFYWHMVPPNNDSYVSFATMDSDGESVSRIIEADSSTVYSPQFSKNFMVGNLGMLDALCTTWFGTESLYVHMINLIPVTAVTGELFGANYAALEYKEILQPLGTVEVAWNGFVIADKAISDPQGAWEEAQHVLSPTLDAGLSKTQLLYWIATRQSFNATLLASACSSNSSKNGTNDDDGGKVQPTAATTLSLGTASACSDSPSCAALGLVGACCPTSSGSMLDCCNK